MILQVENVSRFFGGLQAIAGISFVMPEGCIMGLIGPNGAGKTTLFNIINGVFPPSTGRIVFRGQDITGRPPFYIARQGLARTYQIVRPLGELTVRENAMAGACFGREQLSRRAALVAADEALAQVGLDTRAELPAGALNLSEKKRLEIARALAAKPYLLLLDEVLAGLNPAEVTHMLDLIRQVRHGGTTILIIEHVMQAVMKLSDTILVLESGAVIAQGSPEEVAASPRVIEAYLGDSKLTQALLARAGAADEVSHAAP